MPAGTTTNVSQVSASSETSENLSAQINPELGQPELETTETNSKNMQIAEETSEDVTHSGSKRPHSSAADDSPSRRASPRAYYSHAPLDGLTLTDWNRRMNLHHADISLTHLRGS